MRLRTLVPAGLLIGGIAIGFFVHGPLRQLFQLPAGPVEMKGKPPVDSPVAVRGGSVEFLSKRAWTQSSSGVWVTDKVDATTVTLDGVKLNPASDPEQMTATPTTDWSMTLKFRDSSDNEGSATKLQLCTNFQSGSCQTSGGGISNSNKFYLVDIVHPGYFPQSPPTEAEDGRYLLTYTVPPCQDGSGSSRCSHIKKIHIDGNSLAFKDSSGSVSDPFICDSGICDIGLGQQ